MRFQKVVPVTAVVPKVANVIVLIVHALADVPKAANATANATAKKVHANAAQSAENIQTGIINVPTENSYNSKKKGAVATKDSFFK